MARGARRTVAGALTRPVARLARPGEGVALARLWKILWDEHEPWGGYLGTRDPTVYAEVGRRIDAQLALRGRTGEVARHIHVAAELDGEIVGQVEGWIDRFGVAPSTPPTCEVRSLVVAPSARGLGLGRALLDELATQALSRVRGGRVALAAEVLEKNPAHDFYAMSGFRPVARSLMLDGLRALPLVPRGRRAVAADAPRLVQLDAPLAMRRRAARDPRFDGPRPIDASLLEALAAHVAVPVREPPCAYEIVAEDRSGVVRAAATLALMPLDPPFAPAVRATLARLAVDPATTEVEVLASLLSRAARDASHRGASRLEVTDLGPPGTRLHDDLVRRGLAPWSRTVVRLATSVGLRPGVAS